MVQYAYFSRSEHCVHFPCTSRASFASFSRFPKSKIEDIRYRVIIATRSRRTPVTLPGFQQSRQLGELKTFGFFLDFWAFGLPNQRFNLVLRLSGISRTVPTKTRMRLPGSGPEPHRRRRRRSRTKCVSGGPGSEAPGKMLTIFATSVRKMHCKIDNAL